MQLPGKALLKGISMSFIVKLTSPKGEVFYGAVPDSEGVPQCTFSAEHAVQSSTWADAENSFQLFRQVRAIKDCNYAVVEV